MIKIKENKSLNLVFKLRW